MGVLQGKLVEKLYNYITIDGDITTEHASPAIVGDVCPASNLGIVIFSFFCYDNYMLIFCIEKQTTLSLGEVGYVSGKLGLHSIHTDGEKTISLHVYSPPITDVKIFEPETHSTSRRKPGFYSKYGFRT